MGLNSINTNVAAYYAQGNIGKASASASSSIARLSSGSRIVRAADDVAAMSAGTSLRTNVTTLKMALVNTSQGSSLLQVADGALSQITDILQRQKAISVQAGSGSLTSQERSFLNQEFQNLSKEIDRLVDNTNFNGVTLLDGSLSERVDVTEVDTAAKSASASITWSTNPAVGEDLVLNGVTFNAVAVGAAAGTAIATSAANQIDFNLGTTIQETIDNLVTRLNSLDNAFTSLATNPLTQAQLDSLSQVTYSRSGNSLVITSDKGGLGGQTFRIDGGSSAINGSGTGVGAVSGSGASSTINLLSANQIAATSISVTIVGTTAAAPFTAGTITADLGGGAQTLATLVAGDTMQTLTDKINANTSITGVTASIIGRAGAYNIQLEYEAVDLAAGGAFDATLGGTTTIATALTATLGAVTTNNITYSLADGDDLGIGSGDTVGRGVMGDSILTDQNQQKAAVSVIFPEIADGDLLTTANFGKTTPVNIIIGGATTGNVTFSFTNGGNGPTEANVGATLTETLDNMVATINSYYGSRASNYMLDQISARRDGNNIVIESNDYKTSVGNYATNATLTVTQGSAVTGGSTTNSGNLDNGASGGVSTSGVTNKDFIGTLSGFTATYTGTTDRVNLSIKVGDHTYTTTNNVDTTPSANTMVRFTSSEGGYFDVQMAGSQGQTVSSQADADAIATRLNAAFSSLTFYQQREISSFEGNAPILTDGVVTGSLIGTSISLQGTDFESISIDKIRVTTPSGSNENGKIVFTINGEDYTTDANIGNQLGAHANIKLVSASDADKYLTIHTGDVAIEFDTDAKAASFQSALEDAFGVGNGSAELKFQVGVTTEDTLSVGLNNITTSKIFGGASLDVLTADAAASASDIIDDAIDMVTSVRAEVGAMQSRFDFATANIESSIQNQDAARGTLLDTDVAAESTKFSTAQVQLQAGIAVLAQANQLPQNLLKLIG